MNVKEVGELVSSDNIFYVNLQKSTLYLQCGMFIVIYYWLFMFDRFSPSPNPAKMFLCLNSISIFIKDG